MMRWFMLLLDLLLFASWMTVLGILPFVTLAGIGLALLAFGASGAILWSIPTAVTMGIVAAPSAFVASIVVWAARLSTVYSRRYDLDDPRRLGFLAVNLGFAIPILAAVLGSLLAPQLAEIAVVVGIFSICLWCLTAWLFVRLAAWGTTIYIGRMRPYVRRCSLLVMPELPAPMVQARP